MTIIAVDDERDSLDLISDLIYEKETAELMQQLAAFYRIFILGEWMLHLSA